MTSTLRVPHARQLSEIERLERLRSFGILDTPVEASFQRIVERAHDAFPGTTIAAVSLIDTNRQWFKASVGLDVREVPLAASFCVHAIKADGPLIVEDATKDFRFATNPAVIGALGIRFYVGMPLIDQIGALCVAGLSPRKVTASELKNLQALTTFVNTRLTLHSMERKLRKAGEQSGSSHSAPAANRLERVCGDP